MPKSQSSDLPERGHYNPNIRSSNPGVTPKEDAIINSNAASKLTLGASSTTGGFDADSFPSNSPRSGRVIPRKPSIPQLPGRLKRVMSSLLKKAGQGSDLTSTQSTTALAAASTTSVTSTSIGVSPGLPSIPPYRIKTFEETAFQTPSQNADPVPNSSSPASPDEVRFSGGAFTPLQSTFPCKLVQDPRHIPRSHTAEPRVPHYPPTDSEQTASAADTFITRTDPSGMSPEAWKRLLAHRDEINQQYVEEVRDTKKRNRHRDLGPQRSSAAQSDDSNEDTERARPSTDTAQTEETYIDESDDDLSKAENDTLRSGTSAQTSRESQRAPRRESNHTDFVDLSDEEKDDERNDGGWRFGILPPRPRSREDEDDLKTPTPQTFAQASTFLPARSATAPPVPSTQTSVERSFDQQGSSIPSRDRNRREPKGKGRAT